MLCGRMVWGCWGCKAVGHGGGGLLSSACLRERRQMKQRLLELSRCTQCGEVLEYMAPNTYSWSQWSVVCRRCKAALEHAVVESYDEVPF